MRFKIRSRFKESYWKLLVAGVVLASLFVLSMELVLIIPSNTKLGRKFWQSFIHFFLLECNRVC